MDTFEHLFDHFLVTFRPLLSLSSVSSLFTVGSGMTIPGDFLTILDVIIDIPWNPVETP